MVTKRSTPKAKNISKKEVTTEIHSKISSALSLYVDHFDPKDFEKKLKKATKLFSQAIWKKNKPAKKKVAVKKRAVVKKKLLVKK